MKQINVQFSGRNTIFSYRDTMRKTGEVEKNVDLQTIQEMYNENVYRLTPDLLSGQRVVVDVGAHIGTFSLMAACLGASKVYAIEPNASNYNYLAQNIVQNNFEHRITIIPDALWTSNKVIQMDDFYSDSRIENMFAIESEESKAVTEREKESLFTASTITLEQLIKKYDIQEIDVLKMDIEWAEYEIIPSLTDDVMKKIKYICLEFHGTYPGTFGAMVAHLTRQFSLEILGSYERGGYIYGRRY